MEFFESVVVGDSSDQGVYGSFFRLLYLVHATSAVLKIDDVAGPTAVLGLLGSWLKDTITLHEPM